MLELGVGLAIICWDIFNVHVYLNDPDSEYIRVSIVALTGDRFSDLFS